MELIEKLKEARIIFNEKSRHYLGNWSTRDMDFATQVMVLYPWVYVGGAIPRAANVGNFNSMEESIGVGIGAFLGILFCRVFYDRPKEKRIRENPDEYLCLVGIGNAINRGPRHIRKIIRNELGISGSKKIDFASYPNQQQL